MLIGNNDRKLNRGILINGFILMTLMISSCSAGIETPQGAVAEMNPSAAVPTAAQTASVSAEQAEPANMPAISPTPDTRMKPEDWREWPVVPDQIPAHLAEIYRKGQELGNDPGHFSKVGDCQSIQEALLGMFEKGKPNRLKADEKGLEETIAHFAGSFARDGQAVQGGYNAASVLSPLWANPDACQPGETPLDCELRVHRPSFMIISLEIAFPGRTTETFEKYMRRIIDRAMEKGVVPILLTKADNVEGDHSINLATARLAYEYDIPLVNWWLHAQGMPNRGFDPERDDGFHISMDAWTERSLLVLKTLDSTWKATTGQALAEPTETAPKREETPAAPEQLEVLALPGGGNIPAGSGGPANQAYFGLAKRSGETEIPLGVFRLDMLTGVKTQLLGEGYNLQAVSPDGAQLLVNRGGELFLAGNDGSNPVQLTSSFYSEGRRAASWTADGAGLVFIARQSGGNLLVHYPLDGSGWWKLTTAEDDPVELFTGPTGSYLFLDRSGVVKMVTAPGLPGTTIEEASRVVYSPDGRYLATTVKREGNKTGLVVAAADGSRETPLENIGDHIVETAWSPDGANLVVLTLMVSEYSGQWYDLRNLVIAPADMGTRILPAFGGLNAQAAWSPDGSDILFTSTIEKDGVYVVQVLRYDFSTRQMTDLSEGAGMKDVEFLMTTNVFRR